MEPSSCTPATVWGINVCDDEAWFLDRASQAIAGDPRRAIFATSWKRTGRHFPMVWLPRSREVPAVEVTARYTQTQAVAEGHGRLRILVSDAAGERIAVRTTSRHGSVA